MEMIEDSEEARALLQMERKRAVESASNIRAAIASRIEEVLIRDRP